MIDNFKLIQLRKELRELLNNYNRKEKIIFNYDKQFIENLIFEEKIDSDGIKYKDFAFEFELIKKIDLSEISFDNVFVIQTAFNGSKGVKINPQTVYKKSLVHNLFNGVEFIGPFTGADIRETDFSESKGAVIQAEKVLNKSFENTILKDTEIKGSLDGARIKGANFLGCKGVKVDPIRVYNSDVRGASFETGQIIGSFYGANTINTLYNGIFVEYFVPMIKNTEYDEFLRSLKSSVLSKRI
jgi:uncharacterized protein YjbI with pentapeptide repeats